MNEPMTLQQKFDKLEESRIEFQRLWPRWKRWFAERIPMLRRKMIDDMVKLSPPPWESPFVDLFQPSPKHPFAGLFDEEEGV